MESACDANKRIEARERERTREKSGGFEPLPHCTLAHAISPLSIHDAFPLWSRIIIFTTTPFNSAVSKKLLVYSLLLFNRFFFFFSLIHSASTNNNNSDNNIFHRLLHLYPLISIVTVKSLNSREIKKIF